MRRKILRALARKLIGDESGHSTHSASLKPTAATRKIPPRDVTTMHLGCEPNHSDYIHARQHMTSLNMPPSNPKSAIVNATP